MPFMPRASSSTIAKTVTKINGNEKARVSFLFDCVALASPLLCWALAVCTPDRMRRPHKDAI